MASRKSTKSRRPNGAAHPAVNGYLRKTIGGKRNLEHIHVAEKAMGRPLPLGAEVHHVDEDRANNANSNLVICPDSSYHKLLHMRARARDACGNPNWRKCELCHTWDDTENLLIGKRGQAKHAACVRQYFRDYRAARRAKGAIS